MYKENTTGTAAYIYGPTGRLALRTTVGTESHTFYYHTDHLGSTRVVTDESKTIVTDAAYEPFGETTVTGEEPFLFTGKEKDSTGLSYYNARYYDPETGRFITRDPLAGRKVFPQSLNRYTYCLNNPVKFIDPSGLAVERFCNVDTGMCISISDSDHHWIAYDANGNIITSSREIERLLLSGSPEDLARAAYLMLLVTHPEIEGDPNAEITPADFMNTEHTTFFKVTVTIEGKDVTLYIGIDDRPFFEGKDGKKYYGDAYEHSDGSVQIVLFRKAFSSLKTLFHVVGHEGQHIVDLVKYEGPILPKDRDDDIDLEEDAYTWNINNNNKPPYNVPWPWTWPIPYS